MSSTLVTHYRPQNGASAYRSRSFESASSTLAARLRPSREASSSDEVWPRLAARMADHYCSQDGMQAFCEGVLTDIAKEMNAADGWILLAERGTGRVESLAYCGRGATDPKWQNAVALVSRLIAGGAALEESPTGHGSKDVAVALRNKTGLFGALVLSLEPPAWPETAAHRGLLPVSRILSVYLSAFLDSAAREEARRCIGSSLVEGGAYAPGIVGRSEALIRVLERVEQVAPTDATVLVEGENGTGKELVARALHLQSRRADKPWVVINCAAIPEQLLESELFGHERGAFTGAFERRVGRFEQADGGTVFLDEIGEMPLSLQVKLLRLLQERTVQRLGGGRDIPVNVRFIAATNRNLTKMKEEGKFREDLYWRLYVVPIHVPALRERPEDIRFLALHFARRYAGELGVEPPRFDPAVMECFQRHGWPGNVRELQNLVHRLVILAKNGQILKNDLPLELRRDDRFGQTSRHEPFRDLLENAPQTYDELMERRRDLVRLASHLGKKLENDFVDAILQRHRGNKTRAAQDTGMHRTLIHRNLRRRGILVAD